MKAPHTTGPWEARGGSRVRKDGGINYVPCSVYGNDGKAIASLGLAKSRSFSESEANARLLAAAPELLEALIAMTALAMAWVPGGSKLIKSAEVTIAKAKGK